jgi:8-oxo-dGTP diphosphatase
MKKIEVVAGVIHFKNKILCVQRPPNKLSYISEKFEFPGGKIESGESHKEALKRELEEELSITARINELYLTVRHAYPDFDLTMHAYQCEVDSKEIVLHEHIDEKWLTLSELSQLDWAAADLPIVAKLIGHD